MQFTDLSIRALKPPETGYAYVWDSTLRGFGIRLSAKTGSKTFCVLIGNGRRQTIGKYGPKPNLSLADARDRAKTILAEKTLGKVRPTFHAYEDARDQFLQECETRLRPLTVKLYRRHLTVHFPFARKSVGDITPREIVTRLNRLNDRPSEKEHAYRILRTFMAWCVSQHLIEDSPMGKLAKPPMGAARERVLTEEELRAVYKAATGGHTGFHRLVSLLIHTGGRRGEITALTWADIGSDAITIRAEISKSKKSRRIPLGPRTKAMIERFPKMGEYVFPASRESKPTTTVMTGYSAAKRAFDKECGVAGWTLHDLRRVFAVGLLKQANCRQETVEVLLGHVGSRAGIVGVYQVHDWAEEARAAMEKWEAYLASL